MDKHPNQYLNEFVAHFALIYLKNSGYQVTGSRINTATWKFLEKSQIDATIDPWELGDIAHQAAILQRSLVVEDHPNPILRSVIREFPYLMPLVAHGPQAWLINTYRQALENLTELDKGIKKYGPNEAVYRNIEENVMAAKMMFKTASLSNAAKILELYRKTPYLAFIEGGAGNGDAILSVLKKFHSVGIHPDYLVTDIDLKTRTVAESHFRENGFPGKFFPWAQLDLGNVSDLTFLARSFTYQKLVFYINFIAHEGEALANQFFNATNKSTPKADIIVSEFFLPDKDSELDSSFPWWFVFLHEISGQKLRTEKDFLKITTRHGYKVFNRIDHQVINQTPVVSTLFLTK
jgi:hypothetical protein